jgi:hypothetical protein
MTHYIFMLVYYIVACLLKARIVKPAETAVAREWLFKRPLLDNGSVAAT